MNVGGIVNVLMIAAPASGSPQDQPRMVNAQVRSQVKGRNDGTHWSRSKPGLERRVG